MHNINKLQGQEIYVFEILLEVILNDTSLSMKILLNNEPFSLKFNKVSNLNIKNFSFPFQICGFEILDNRDKRWDRSSRFTVHDFEDNKLLFSCEEYEIE